MGTSVTSNDTAILPERPAGKPPLDPSLSYTPREVGSYLGVSTQTLAKWHCTKRGPSFVKIGRTITYRGRDVLAYEARCVVEIGEAA